MIEQITNADQTFRIAVDPRGDCASWQMDARIDEGAT
jgi:hypothetical protein